LIAHGIGIRDSENKSHYGREQIRKVIYTTLTSHILC